MVLYWIVVGLVAGSLAKLLMPGKDPGGCIVTVLLGIAGAVVGGLVGTYLGWGSFQGFDLRSMGLAVGGSCLLLGLYRLVFGGAGKEAKSKKKD